uniref:Fibronectin type-III domain-containing protein n=1 Tax=Gongylonema pulchrum TaxID=637853 RepID=A0A183DJ95_9BILA
LVNITAEEIAKSSATFRVTLRSAVVFDPPECSLHIVVLDMRSMTIYDRITPITPTISPIVLEGLRPYHRYTIRSELRTMDPISFETQQDRPGPVRNLTVRILNPYSAQLFWLPPALPNGIITHYIVSIHPMVCFLKQSSILCHEQ